MKRVRTLALLTVLFFAMAFAVRGRAAQAATVHPGVQTRTIQQIRAFAEKNGVKRRNTTYDEEPVRTAPYAAGKLSAKTTNEALAMLNFVRYIAGLDANVTVDETYQQQAQAAALVNAVNNELTHEPKQPENMDYSLYQMGVTGAARSNLGMGYRTLPTSIVEGYLDDSDPSNLPMLGHRRWILNPSMGKTGFGHVGAYMALYAMDSSNSSSADLVVWPAQKTPVQLFNRFMAWSVSTSRDVDQSKLKVTVSRRGTGESWEFTNEHSDGYLNYSIVKYGGMYCLIFLPAGDFDIAAGEIYDVTVVGIGSDTLTYSVEFFDMKDLWYEPATISLSTEATGLSEIDAPEAIVHYDWAGYDATGCYLHWSYPSCVKMETISDSEARFTLTDGSSSEPGVITAKTYDPEAVAYVSTATINLPVYQTAYVPYVYDPTSSFSGVTVTWQKPYNFDESYQFEVYRKTGSGSFVPIGRSKTCSYVDKTAKFGTTYTYSVCCLSADGKHQTSNYSKTGKTITHEKTGWEQVGSAWYYWKKGVRQTGWVQVSGKWYYMNSSGVMQTGWQKISGKWYYLNASGVMQTGWVQVSGKWYYMNSSGAMQTGWQKISNKWYYMNSSGVMQTGWLQLSGKWYYMNSSGVMQTGWTKVSGKYYYMNSSGVMQTGWVQVSNKWYYMNSSGVMQTGWKQLSGKWYYFGEDGAMYRANTYYIDGKYYKFDSNGVWVG
ncbi:MAG: hypothetical protein II930_02395 [Lachnospiraceae bacterium]|nr:hypothetical protein [Lachnospiraceae bacterium]